MGNQKSGDKDSEGFLYKLVKDYYSHLLLKEWVRPIVVGSPPTTQINDRFTAYYTNLWWVTHNPQKSMICSPTTTEIFDMFTNYH